MEKPFNPLDIINKYVSHPKISQIVNAKNSDFGEQISSGEAAVIFNSLTSSKNFPIYLLHSIDSF